MAVITQQYIDAIHQYEGGLTGDPRDPASKNPSNCGIDPKYGKPYHTNRGVTFSTFTTLAPKLGYTADCATFLKMDSSVWIPIFKQGYWDPIQLDTLNSNGLAYLLADFSWGSGPGYVAPFLNKFLSSNYGVSASTIPAQISALNTLVSKNEQDVIQKVSAARLDSLKSMKGGSLFATYGTGWSRRLSGLTNLAMSMVGKVEEEAKAAVATVKKHPYITIAVTTGIIVGIYFIFKLLGNKNDN